MKCPKCGYTRQLRDNAYVPRNVCPSCGTVYSKSVKTLFARDGLSSGPGMPLKSPVDESSLQQARERVERRLRKQMESRLKDERHQQTLARAKKIAATEVRKRMQAQESLRNANDTLSGISVDDTLSEILKESPLRSSKTVNDTWPAAGQPRFETLQALQPEVQAGLSNGTRATVTFKPRTPAKADGVIPTDKATQAHQTGKTRTFGRNAQQALSNGLAEVQPVIAWLILVAGVVGAILSWTTITDVEAGVRPSSLEVGRGVLPLGLLLGFAYLATGVLGFAFFWATNAISRQLKDIRLLLLTHPRTPPQE